MAFFRSLKQNLLHLQAIFRKRKRSPSVSSRKDTGRNNSENNPVRNPPDQNQAPIEDIGHVQTSSAATDVESKPQERSRVRQRTQCDEHSDLHCPQVNTKSPAGTAPKNIPSQSSKEPDSDSEAEEKCVSRCQCSRNPPFSQTPNLSGKCAASFAEEFYGDDDKNRLNVQADRDTPSTSWQTDKLGSASGGTTDTGQSSCSMEDQLMEEMVSTLKICGSLNKRRSRSRSRRSRPRQNYENGIVVNNVRVVQTVPRRETDSDDSNTSLNDPSLPFLSSTHQDTPSHSNIQSDSSFHSATGSEVCTTPQASSASTKMEEEMRLEEETEEWVGVNSTEHNRNRIHDPIVHQIEELAPYGPEEFVLDILLAMCRGTWSDIL